MGKKLTNQELHEKRRKRTSLKKADQYRAQMEFFKQRYLTLMSDLGDSRSNADKLSSARDLLNKDVNSLRSEVSTLNSELKWFRGLWFVRLLFKLKLITYSKSFPVAS